MSDGLIGRLVLSISGRDKGKAFILVGTDGQGFYFLADGNIHKIGKPKKKNPKHVQITNQTVQGIRSMLLEGKKPKNHEIQYAIQQILKTTK